MGIAIAMPIFDAHFFSRGKSILYGFNRDGEASILSRS
jgi:hypothetical protein